MRALRKHLSYLEPADRVSGGREEACHCQKYTLVSLTNRFLHLNGSLGIDKWLISALIPNVANFSATNPGILVSIYPG